MEVARNTRVTQGDRALGAEPFAEEGTSADLRPVEGQGVAARIPEGAVSTVEISSKADTEHAYFANREEAVAHYRLSVDDGLVGRKRDGAGIVEVGVRTVQHSTDSRALEANLTRGTKSITQKHMAANHHFIRGQRYAVRAIENCAVTREAAVDGRAVEPDRTASTKAIAKLYVPARTKRTH